MKKLFERSLYALLVGVLLIASGLRLDYAPAAAYDIYQGQAGSKILISPTTVLVTPNGSAVASTNAMPIGVGDNPSLDAAGRLRISTPYGAFDDKTLYANLTYQWEDVASGVAAAASFVAAESSYQLTVGTGATDYIYHTSPYIAYNAGKSTVIKITGLFGTAVANTTKSIGYFDDNDGLFFRQTIAGISTCIRTSTSGSPVTNCVLQSSWNLDKMDGTGPSHITLDPTKSQLFVIDFLWQGLGRVRYGFNIDGITYYVHQEVTANHSDKPYMSSPSLPVRVELQNTGVSVGATMKIICVSVESEGGYELPGYEFAASNGITTRAVTTRLPVLAIRMTTTFGGKTNRQTAKLNHSSYYAITNDSFCELVHVHPPYTIDGAWVAANADSSVEYNVTATAITATHQHLVDSNYISAAAGQRSAPVEKTFDFLNLHSMIHQNAQATQSEMFVIYCTSFIGTSNISTELNWNEFQ